MGLVQYMAREALKELDNRSREFYEFIMPAIDIFEDGSDLVVMIDLPGFAKKDIKLRIIKDILSINAKRDPENIVGTIYIRHRPNQINKKVVLPLSIGEDDDTVVGAAKYTDGVLTLRIPIPKSSTIPVS